MAPRDPPSDPRVSAPVAARHAADSSVLALRFIGLSLGIFVAAFSLAWALAQLLGRNPRASAWTMVFHPAFAVSSGLMVYGSYCLSQSLAAVRRERQQDFRMWLRRGLLAGGLFTAVQTYALWAISAFEHGPDAASRGVRPFIILLCALHALHFVIAIMSLAYVTVRAYADKYDHEYHWGVTVCNFFWHFLGVVWGGVLAVIMIAL